MTPRRVLLTGGGILLALLIIAPLLGWPSVVRLPALALPVIGSALAIVRPWTWSAEQWRRWHDWTPSTREICWGAAALALLLGWIVLTRFHSGQINAVDFTVYFDRPAMRTVQGQLLRVETADLPGFSNRNQLAVHAYWAMLPLTLLYAIHATPYWLLAISVLAVVAGAGLVVRLALRLGATGFLAVAAAFSFALNDNTARALNYGFHPEIVYAVAVPWFLLAGLSKSPMSFLCATLLCVMVKEDAVMVLAAGVLLLWLCRRSAWTARDWALYALVPIGLAAINLGVYYRWVVPVLVAGGRPTYSAFWATFGDTPLAAAAGLATHPALVLQRVATSGLWRVLAPFLFIPVVGWRATLGTLPIFLIYGASDNEQLRAFGLYYSVVVTPFLAAGSVVGAIAIASRTGIHPASGQARCAVALLAGALLVGSTAAGYSVRPWKPELRAVRGVIDAIPPTTPVLVQSGLMPFAGYERRVQLLTADSLMIAGATGAVIMLSRDAGFYPLARLELDVMLNWPRVAAGPGPLIVVRPQPAPDRADPPAPFR